MTFIKRIATASALLFVAFAPFMASAQGYRGGGWGMGLGGLLGLAAMVFWVLMIIHAATHPIGNKVLWIIILVFTGIVGALIYYFVVVRNPSDILPPTSKPPAAKV